MSEPPPLLRLRRVSKHFPTPAGDRRVLAGVDLELRPGELAALTGPSGSGKTTLLHIAALLEPATGGAVEFDGLDAASLDEAARCALRRDHVGMVFQRFHLLEGRTVLENVAFRFRYRNESARDANRAALRALERVGLAPLASARARRLSSGEQQRVAIARAIAVRPRLLLADEPTGNLDRRAAGDVIDTLASLRRDGIAVLLATHNEALAERGSRRLVCRDGHLDEVRA